MEEFEMDKKTFKYGKPLSPTEMPKPRKRLPQYDECLKEFLESGYKYWEVNMDALPSKKPRVILSSLKWRVKNKPEFKNIRVFMYKGKIYLERITP
ncbi:MAG: hypothetical protein QXD95_07490 [Nitrososphaeria archaeon]